MNQVANTHSIRFKLISVFSLFAGIIVVMVTAFTWVETKVDHLNDLSNLLTQASLKLNEANNAEKNFVLFETISPRFYRSKESRFAYMHSMHIEDAENYLRQISKYSEAEAMGIRGILQQSVSDLDSMRSTFSKLVGLYLERGFETKGLIGQMKEQIAYVEEASGVDQIAILSVRKAEKDYIIHKQVQYMSRVRLAVDKLKSEVRKLPDAKLREELLSHLNSYWLNFLKLVRIEEQIGFKEDRGIKHVLAQMSEATDHDLIQVEEIVYRRTLQFRQRLFWGILIMGVFFIGITAIAGVFVLRRLGKPIKSLSDNISAAIDSQFRQDLQLESLDKKDEIGQISRDVDYLYSKIRAYATELMQQKEEIMMQAENLSRVNTDLEEKTEQIFAKNFELEHQNEMIAKQRDQIERSLSNIQMLSKIGQEVTNHLHIEEVIQILFDNAQNLMPVSVFSVGLFNTEKKGLDFYGIEAGKKEISRGFDPIGDKSDTLSAYAFLKEEEVLIQNLEASYVEFVSQKPKVLEELGSQSVIYLPLKVKNACTGVITVQHTETNAYSNFQVGMLRNLASYTAIALDNAKVYETLNGQRVLLSEQAVKLKQANAEVSEKNRAIMSSINYAKRMQESILPKVPSIQEYLPKLFVLFEPRDVVSGDFYFFTSVVTKGKEYWVIAAVDCTGHGVPGAFTAMLGSSLLDNIVNQRKQVDPGKILSQLHKAIAYTFRQEESDNKDGMDMALCVIDREEQTLSFAGAKNPLVYVQDGQMQVIKGDRYSIGGGDQGRKKITFTTHVVDVSEKPITFYLYSDGYQDQFGGEDSRKLMGRRFRELLYEHCEKGMDEQRESLREFFHSWMQEGKEKQLDDMLVIGSRIGPGNW